MQKQSCSVQDKNFLVLSGAWQKFSIITRNEMRSFMDKIIIQDSYDQNQKSLILEFLYLEKHPTLRAGQVLHQMGLRGNIASFTLC